MPAIVRFDPPTTEPVRKHFGVVERLG